MLILVELVIGAALGWVAYREVGRHAVRYGRLPWGGSPPVWAVVCFLFGLIGCAILLVAMRTSRKPIGTAMIQPGAAAPAKRPDNDGYWSPV